MTEAGRISTPEFGVRHERRLLKLQTAHRRAVISASGGGAFGTFPPD